MRYYNFTCIKRKHFPYKKIKPENAFLFIVYLIFFFFTLDPIPTYVFPFDFLYGLTWK